MLLKATLCDRSICRAKPVAVSAAMIEDYIPADLKRATVQSDGADGTEQVITRSTSRRSRRWATVPKRAQPKKDDAKLSSPRPCHRFSIPRRSVAVAAQCLSCRGVRRWCSGTLPPQVLRSPTVSRRRDHKHRPLVRGRAPSLQGAATMNLFNKFVAPATS
eukprot:SAG31_NODE_204_length_20414_cov_19.143392_22_plen_161_part_00